MEMEADFFREKAHRGKGFVKSTFVIRVEKCRGRVEKMYFF